MPTSLFYKPTTQNECLVGWLVGWNSFCTHSTCLIIITLKYLRKCNYKDDIEDWLAAEQHFVQHAQSQCAGVFYTLIN